MLNSQKEMNVTLKFNTLRTYGGSKRKEHKKRVTVEQTLPEDLLQFKVSTPAGDGSLQGGLLQQQRVSQVFVNLHKHKQPRP